MTVSTAHSSYFLEAICKHAPFFIIWKDTAGIVQEMNQYTAQVLGYQHWTEAIGKKESEHPFPISKAANIWAEQDRRVIQKNERLTILDVHIYTNQETKTCITQKYPLKDENQKTIGVLCIGFEIREPFLGGLVAELSKIHLKINPLEQPLSLSIEETDPYHLLSSRESECLFFLLRGKSATEIASIINLSKRTIEEYIVNVKKKMQCNTRSELIERCIHQGYIHVIPKSLLPDLSACLEGTLV
jgi:DNA-binding CsgD family transcriptional regulator